jgi:hypothetical protein
MTDAEKRFNDMFHGLIRRWLALHSFRRHGFISTPRATRTLDTANLDFIKSVSSAEETKVIFKNHAAFAGAAHFLKLSHDMTIRSKKQFQGIADAACLALAQSIASLYADQAARVIAIHTPLDWMPFFGKRKIRPATAKDVTGENSATEFVIRYVENTLRHQALSTKMSAIYEICRQATDAETMEGYMYDAGRLEVIRNQVGSLICGTAQLESIPDIDATLKYLQDTSMSALGLLNARYGFKIDEGYFPAA